MQDIGQFLTNFAQPTVLVARDLPCCLQMHNSTFSTSGGAQSRKGCASTAARHRTSLTPCARYSSSRPSSGNYDSNPRFQPNKGSGLILPGQSNGGPARPQKLVLPDDEPKTTPPGGVIPPPPTHNRFRPPPGFMDDRLKNDITANMDANDMLNKLRSRAGKWHELAKYFPGLNAKGVDTAGIDEATGITPAQQNKFMVAGTVHDSLVSSGKVSAEIISYFDSDEGADLLYPFRFLAAERRVAAALYVVQNALEEQDCEMLARAMKEYERRPVERVGFSDQPGDCLAFKYLRDAFECRRREDQIKYVHKGLSVATSDEAIKRLEELLKEEAPAALNTTTATLTVLRLSADELGFRPLPVAGQLGEATAASLQGAPTASQSGSFGVFNISSDGYQWVALPVWQVLALAKEPVAIAIPDCSQVPAVIAGTRAVKEEEKKRLSGAGLLLVDRVVTEVTPANYYLLSDGDNEPLRLKEGITIDDNDKVVAVVLFVARPPPQPVEITTSDLLQI